MFGVFHAWTKRAYQEMGVVQGPTTRNMVMTIARNVKVVVGGDTLSKGVSRSYGGRVGYSNSPNVARRFLSNSRYSLYNQPEKARASDMDPERRVNNGGYNVNGSTRNEEKGTSINKSRGVCHLSNQELMERRRKGLCYKCGKKFHPLH